MVMRQQGAAVDSKKRKEERVGEENEEEVDTKRDRGVLLPAYVRMWAVATAVRVTTSAGAELRYKTGVAVAVLPTLCIPQLPLAVVSALCVRILSLMATTPYLHDSQVWCLHTDFALLIAVLTVLRRRRRGGKQHDSVMDHSLVRGFTREEAVDIMAHTSSIVRIQLLLFYTSAALYKFNSGFMHPRFSCAPLFLVQLMDAYLPISLQFPSLITAVTAAAPSLILLVEAIIPVLMYIEPRIGAVFAALFHWAIAITPPPNMVASFGAQTLPRVLLLLPDPTAVTRALTSFATTPGSWRGAVVILVAALTTALQPSTWTTGVDVNVPLCGAFAAIVCISAATSSSAKRGARALHASRIGVAGSVLCCLGMLYALVVVPLGLCDMGTANMFSSLRMHGGSNHYLFPTGLLQRMFVDVSPSASVFGDCFGGGVVRIENTNASGLAHLPGEVVGHTSRALEMLAFSGHSAKQWMPMAFVCPHAIGEGVINNRKRLVAIHRDAFTLPAPELRRVIHNMRSRYSDEDWDIEGVLLPGAEGDEEWRANAAAARFVLQRRGSGSVRCVDTDTDVACASWLHAILLTPPSSHPLAFLFRKLLLHQPHPILPEDAGDHRRVHCVM